MHRYTIRWAAALCLSCSSCVGGKEGEGQPSHLWAWQPRLTSEVHVGVFVLPKADEATGRRFPALTE